MTVLDGAICLLTRMKNRVCDTAHGTVTCTRRGTDDIWYVFDQNRYEIRSE